MITPVQRPRIQYTVQPVPSGGFTIFEDQQPIAFCMSGAYAQAIRNALSFYRSMISFHQLLYVRPSRTSHLN